MRKQGIGILILAAGALVFFIGFLLYDKSKPRYRLAYYGPKEAIAGKRDTVYHRVADFSFLNQEGKTVTSGNFNGKIYVADFFFTTCKGICIKMTGQMQRLQEKFRGNPEIMFISHTVNPENDSVPVLAAYAQAHGAENSQWYFVTGEKKEIYDLARKSYLVVAGEGDGGPHDFIHTENFALVDKEKHIRGYYDGTDSAAVNMLMKDIEVLLSEYNYKEKKK